MRLYLKEERKRRGLSLDDLAAISGISPASLNKWERGKVDPSHSLVEQLERAMGLLPGTLVFKPRPQQNSEAA